VRYVSNHSYWLRPVISPFWFPIALGISLVNVQVVTRMVDYKNVAVQGIKRPFHGFYRLE
jgi:hypothetical protein